MKSENRKALVYLLPMVKILAGLPCYSWKRDFSFKDLRGFKNLEGLARTRNPIYVRVSVRAPTKYSSATSRSSSVQHRPELA